MSGVDLDIDNYNLDDLLALFKLDMNFGEEELRSAKKVVLKMHPDKSGLDKEYFMFFSKAYKLLHSLHTFRNSGQGGRKSHGDSSYDPTDQQSSDSETNRELLKRYSEKTDKPFNVWFNELFEKNNLSSLNESSGYGDWLRPDEDCSTAPVASMRDVNEHIDGRKKELGALMVVPEVGDITSSMGSNLVEGEVEHYDSGVFSSLQYDDLKRAHQESVVAVSEESHGRQSFRDVEHLKQARQSDQLSAHGREQSRAYLANKAEKETAMGTQRAYQLARELERNQGKEREWWGHLKRLT